MSKMCDMCVGFALGFVGGIVISSIPHMRCLANDMKCVIIKDVVKPVETMMKKKTEKIEEALEE